MPSTSGPTVPESVSRSVALPVVRLVSRYLFLLILSLKLRAAGTRAGDSCSLSCSIAGIKATLAASPRMPG